jgi:hypothetical protein
VLNLIRWKKILIPENIIAKYDFQKLGLYKREDAPTFKVKLSHLPHDLIYELAHLNEQDRKFVLKQAVSRIFEDINFDLYHDSISNRLEVELVK